MTPPDTLVGGASVRPVPPPGPAARTRLADHGVAAPLVTLVRAPAGYGKTTMIARWAQDDPRPFARVDLTPAHADPALFVADLIAALEDVEPRWAGEPTDVRGGGGDRRAVPAHLIVRLGRRLRAMTSDVVLVVDGAEAIEDRLAMEALQVVIDNLPQGGHLVVAGRRLPDLRLAALRVEGRLVEVGPADLALGPVEADLLLAGLGIDLSADELERALDLTEGWPAGLVLAGLAIRDEPDRRDALDHMVASDRRVVGYVVEEVLQGVPRELVSLLMRTSVLDSLTAASCSAVMGRDVAPDELEALRRMTAFVVPLDHRGERFRLHHLVADVLRHELNRSEPRVVSALHARVADWDEGQGDPLGALHHLRAAGDDEAAAGLVGRSLLSLHLAGRSGTLREMLDCFSPAEIQERAPLALAMAWTCVVLDGRSVERWTRAAEAAGHEGPLPGGPASVESAVGLLRATVGAGGLEQIGRDARLAYEADGESSPWRAVACLLMGVAEHLGGDAAGARRHLGEAVRRAEAPLPSVLQLAETWQAVMDLMAGDRTGSGHHVRRALDQVEDAGMQECAPSALLACVLALREAEAAEEAPARVHLRHARLQLDHTDRVMPWLGMTGRILLARAALRLGDREAARALIQEAAGFRPLLPDAPVLEAELQGLRAAMEEVSPAVLRGAGSLTAAELRVLRFLPTHLSFRQIGEQVHLSRFTIKSQALSAYRKLGVASRGEAVVRARGLGLLDPPAGPGGLGGVDRLVPSG